MPAKITHALPDVRDLRTSGKLLLPGPPFLRPRDQEKRKNAPPNSRSRRQTGL